MVKSNKNKQVKTKINKDMTFSDVLTRYPNSAGIMMNYGLHCIGCQVAAYETIEQGAKAHGMTNKEFKKMMDELNKAAKKDKIELPVEEKINIEKINKPKKSFFKKLFR